MMAQYCSRAQLVAESARLSAPTPTKIVQFLLCYMSNSSTIKILMVNPAVSQTNRFTGAGSEHDTQFRQTIPNMAVWFLV